MLLAFLPWWSLLGQVVSDHSVVSPILSQLHLITYLCNMMIKDCCHICVSPPSLRPHSTHSTPPPDTPGALRYHSGDHPHLLSLCHPPNILVSNLHLNSSDLGTSRPQDLWNLGPWDLGTLLALPDPRSRSSTSAIQSF